MIGDSMTMGHGVKESDTIPRILEKKLRVNNHDSQVVNLGLSAANPSLYSQIFRFIALPLKPDIVIVNYYSGNDPQEMIPYAKQAQTYKYIRDSGEWYRTPLHHVPLSWNHQSLQFLFFV